MHHDVMIASLAERRWPPEVVACLAEEYQGLVAQAKVVGAKATRDVPFLRAVRAGGTETPQLLVEMLQVALAP
eukprot:1570050-Lingulodinium_polyedra.AAC.1